MKSTLLISTWWGNAALGTCTPCSQRTGLEAAVSQWSCHVLPFSSDLWTPMGECECFCRCDAG